MTSWNNNILAVMSQVKYIIKIKFVSFYILKNVPQKIKKLHMVHYIFIAKTILGRCFSSY